MNQTWKWGRALLLPFHWSETSHMTKPSCKEGWEMQSLRGHQARGTHILGSQLPFSAFLCLEDSSPSRSGLNVTPLGRPFSVHQPTPPLSNNSHSTRFSPKCVKLGLGLGLPLNTSDSPAIFIFPTTLLPKVSFRITFGIFFFQAADQYCEVHNFDIHTHAGNENLPDPKGYKIHLYFRDVKMCPLGLPWWSHG